MIAGYVASAAQLVDLAETEMAVRNERTHTARLGECQRFAVIGLATLGVEPHGVHRDVAEQMQRLGHETRLKLRRLNRTITQPPGFVDQAKKQSGTAQHAVRAATLTDDPTCRVALNQFLALAEAGQRLVGLADFVQVR